MAGKRVIIGQREWGVEDARYDEVRSRIKEALESGSVAELPLLDADGRPVTVFLNGRVTPTVVVDPDAGPRPTEISG